MGAEWSPPMSENTKSASEGESGAISHTEWQISGGKENPPMKPRPNNGRRVASSDVREYKIGIRGGIKVSLSHLQE